MGEVGAVLRDLEELPVVAAGIELHRPLVEQPTLVPLGVEIQAGQRLNTAEHERARQHDDDRGRVVS